MSYPKLVDIGGEIQVSWYLTALPETPASHAIDHNVIIDDDDDDEDGESVDGIYDEMEEDLGQEERSWKR